MAHIESLRDDIKNIDYQILELVLKRMELAKQIGVEKKKLSLPIFDKKVAGKVIERNIKKSSEFGLDTQLGRELTELLMKYSIMIQEECYN